MTDTSVDSIGIVRSILREMILSEAVRPPTASELDALEGEEGVHREFALDTSHFFRAEPIASMRSNDAEIQKILANSSASMMAIARITIDKSDLDRLEIPNKVEPERNISLANRLRKLRYFRKIAKGTGTGITFLSSGEIEEVARQAAIDRGTKDRFLETYLFIEMMGDKISAVIILLNVVKEFILLLTENTLIESAQNDKKEKGEELTDADKNRIKSEAKALIAGRAFAAASAVARLASINTQMNNYMIALKSHNGFLPGVTARDEDVSSMTRERIIKALNDTWGGDAVGTYMRLSQAQVGAFVTPQRREMVGRGTAVDVTGIARGDTGPLEAAIVMFNRLLSMQGLGESRGKIGKGITGYNEETGSIDRNIRDPAMINQVIDAKRLFDAAEESVETSVKDRSFVRMSRERIEKMISKARGTKAKMLRQMAAEMSKKGESIVKLSKGRTMTVVATGSPADLKRQKLLKITSQEAEREAERQQAAERAKAEELGFTALAGEKRVEAVTSAITSYFGEALRRSASNISVTGAGREAASNNSKAAMRNGDYVKAAYAAFIQPIAKALTEGGFCDLKALSEVSSVSPSTVKAAANERQYASSLMSQRLNAGDSGRRLGVYEQILQRSAHGRESDLQAMFSGKPGESLIVNPAEVEKALHKMREESFADGQNKLFEGGVSLLIRELANVVNQAIRSNPAHFEKIKRMFEELEMGRLIDDIEEDDVFESFSYIVGTPLEPIRIEDIADVKQQRVSYNAGFNTPAARSAAPGSEEERAAAEKGMVKIAQSRAQDAMRRREAELRGGEGEEEEGSLDVPDAEDIGAGTSSGDDFSDLDEGRMLESLRRALLLKARTAKAVGR